MRDGDTTVLTTTSTTAAFAGPDPKSGGRPPHRSGFRTWARRCLVGTAATLVTVAMLGAVYQTAATRTDQRAYPPPGQLVDAGGHRLHINCAGHGSPTVILEAANLGMSAHWVRVQQQVAASTRVCSYDRAGMGWSDAGPEPRDATAISAELHTLLTSDEAAAPYVLAGHSYGGLYTLGYAATYPGEVAGVVLIDSSHPEQFVRSPAGQAMFKRTSRSGAVLGWLTRLGVTRAIHLLPAHPDLPPEQRGQIKAFNSSTRQVITSVQEFRATPQTSELVRSTPGLANKPLAVVTAGEQPSDWLQLQDELAALSSNSVHQEVSGATHASLLFADRDAAVSSAAIVHVVQSLRNGRPLHR
jgi:pimeloyl-ACP methyl ester carboxylesterase